MADLVPAPPPPLVAVGTCRVCRRVVPLDGGGLIVPHGAPKPCIGARLTSAQVRRV